MSVYLKECLVIIDVQKGFLTEDTCFVPEKIRTLINKRKFEYVIATRFINSKESPHYIFTQWDGMMDEESQRLDPFVAQVAEKIFDKNTNSCFTDEFLEYIENKHIEKLCFVGIDTDCCVMKSAFDSFDRKIPFEVLTKYCASTGGKVLHNEACHIMKRSLGEISIK